MLSIVFYFRDQKKKRNKNNFFSLLDAKGF